MFRFVSIIYPIVIKQNKKRKLVHTFSDYIVAMYSQRVGVSDLREEQTKKGRSQKRKGWFDFTDFLSVCTKYYSYCSLSLITLEIDYMFVYSALGDLIQCVYRWNL